MKISKKILAAAMAATLAATSMASVAGATATTTAAAEEKKVDDQKSYDIWNKAGRITGNDTAHFEVNVNKEIADNLVQTHKQLIELTELGFDFGNTTANGLGEIKSVKLTVTGFQTAASATPLTKTFEFEKNAVLTDKGTWQIVVLDNKTPVYNKGEFASFYFYRITDMSLDVEVGGITDNYTTSEAAYKALETGSVSIGKINIYNYNAKGTALADTTADATFGGTTATDAYNDKQKVLDAAAKKTLLSYEAGATENASKAGEGWIIGTQIGINNLGNAFTEATASYTGSADTTTGVGAGTAGNLDKVVTKVELKNNLVLTTTAADNTTIVGKTFGVDGKLAVSKNIYEITATGATSPLLYLVTDKTLSAADIKTITDAATGPAAMAAITALDATITNETKMYVPVAANVVGIVDEVPADLTVYANQATGATTTTAKGFLIRAKDSEGNTIYKKPTGVFYGQAFNTVQLSEADATAPLLAYAFGTNGFLETKNKYKDSVTIKVGRSDDLKLYGWLPMTTATVGADIRRNNVWELSDTSDYDSMGRGVFENTERAVTDDYSAGSGQTYKDNTYQGTYSYGFAGLASQVADFFNKAESGSIKFTYTAKAAAGGAADPWSVGIPSTEVGLKTSIAGGSKANFALFFNYKSTTGTMVADAKIDESKSEIEVPIDQYLADCNGLTKATLQDIYYGLNTTTGTDKYAKRDGIRVSKVELIKYEVKKADAAAANDEKEAAVTTTTAAETTKATTTEIAIKDDEDEKVQPVDTTAATTTKAPETTAALIETTTAAGAQGNNSAPATTDNDTNPGTGVALAVVPAAIAAAAMVVSKKRK